MEQTQGLWGWRCPAKLGGLGGDTHKGTVTTIVQPPRAESSSGHAQPQLGKHSGCWGGGRAGQVQVSLKHSQGVPVASPGTGTLSAAQCSSVSPQVPLAVTCQRVHGPVGLTGVRGAHPGVPPMPPWLWGFTATSSRHSPAGSCQLIEETRPQ